MSEYLISEEDFTRLKWCATVHPDYDRQVRATLTDIIEDVTQVPDTASPDIFLTWYRALDLAAKIDPGRAMIRDDLVSMATFLFPVLLSPPAIPEEAPPRVRQGSSGAYDPVSLAERREWDRKNGRS